jgi:FAD binding domain-containing protein
MNTAIATDLEAAERLRDLFARFQPRIVTGPLFDFSKLKKGVPVFCEVAPPSAEAVSRIVQLAREQGVPLRTRGKGHALNGSSLPRNGELVVHTRELIATSHHSDGTVSVGAGAVLWSVDASLRTMGRSLPVLNDGYAGPSVGGYAAAGGFGPGSRIAGGFWDNVAELTIVDGEGRIRRLSRDATLFPWLFGAMGQLGIIVEARLDTVAAPPIPEPERVALLGRSLLENQPSHSAPPAPDEAGRLFWFTLFVAESSLDEARVQLESLELKHLGTFAFRNRYTYFITHRLIVAPLVWPYSTPCYAVGSWGILKDVTSRDVERVLAFDADFTEMTLANGYRRYVQSELPFGPDLYERYFGHDMFSRFRALKQAQDPLNLFNRGWVFET